MWYKVRRLGLGLLAGWRVGGLWSSAGLVGTGKAGGTDGRGHSQVAGRGCT